LLVFINNTVSLLIVSRHSSSIECFFFYHRFKKIFKQNYCYFFNSNYDVRCRHLINIPFLSLPLSLFFLLFTYKLLMYSKKRVTKKKFFFFTSCHEDHFTPKCNRYFFVWFILFLSLWLCRFIATKQTNDAIASFVHYSTTDVREKVTLETLLFDGCQQHREWEKWEKQCRPI
jgi:hypothetical protein